MGHAAPRTSRRGVIASEARRIRSVQSPSVVVTKLIGFAVRSSRANQYRSVARGARPTPQIAALSAMRARRDTDALVELPEIHAGVEVRDLVGVAVERERGAAPELADPPLGGLAPARVVDRGVDVRVETVLLRRGLVPRGWRLLTREPDPHDRFRALESVLPRHDHADRGAVLVRQHLAVHADGQERQRVERLVEAQPLRVRPVERRSEKARPLAGELSRVEQRREFDVLRLPGRLDPRSEEHTSELQSHSDLVCRLLLEKKKKKVAETT